MAARKPAARLARNDRIALILEAAREVFCEKGFEKTAVSEIAARIGIVEGTIYKYFDTKRELLLKVLENWYEEMFGDYSRELAAVAGTRERLRLLIWRHLCTVRDEPQLCRLMFREVRSGKDYHSTSIYAMNRRYTQLLMHVITQGMAAGELRDDINPALLRDMVYGGIEHHVWAWMNGHADKPLAVDLLTEQISAALWAGVATHKDER